MNDKLETFYEVLALVVSIVIAALGTIAIIMMALG